MSSASSPSNQSGTASAPAAQDLDNQAMNKDSALIYLFEKMGVPLINAIAAVQLWKNMDKLPDGDPEDLAKQEAVEYATNLATLLNRTVSLSTALSQKLELSPTEDQRHRLDIAAVSTLMIAHQYALMARIPEERDITKITSSLESVLSFADYFSAGEDMRKHAQRSSDALLVDSVDAVVPLVQTIGRFSFGRNEKTLLSEILNDLGQRVDALTKAFGQDMADRNLTSEKMQIFKGCAQLLTLCYESEMNALLHEKGGDHPAAAGKINDDAMDKALKRIWECFDSRVALLRTVLGYVNDHFTGAPQQRTQKQAEKPAPANAQSSDGQPASPIQAVIDKNKKNTETSSPKDKDDDNSPDGDNEGGEDQSGNDGDFNPMSFFTGK